MSGHQTNKHLLSILENVKPQSLPVWQALIAVFMLSVFLLFAFNSSLIAQGVTGSGIVNISEELNKGNIPEGLKGEISAKIKSLNKDFFESAKVIVEEASKAWYIYDNSTILYVKMNPENKPDISRYSFAIVTNKLLGEISVKEDEIETLREHKVESIFAFVVLLLIGIIVGFILSPKIPKKAVYRALRISRESNLLDLTTRTLSETGKKLNELSVELSRPKNVNYIPVIKMSGEAINNKISNIKKYIQNIESLVSGTKQKTDPITKPNKIKLDSLIKLYNSAVDDRENNIFTQKYLTQVGYIEYKTKKLNFKSGSDETFTESVASGNYIMMNMDDNYVVVPKLNFTLNSDSSDSLKKAFNFEGFDPSFIYSNIKLIKPAFFEPDSGREEWKVKERGELDLGRGVIATTPERFRERLDTRQTKKPPQTPVEKLCELYNKKVDNPNSFDFDREYSNVKRLGVENAMVRRGNISIPPIFKEANDGDYLIITLNGGNYAVAPRHNLDFNSNIYGFGAMNEVFDCGDFNPNLTYRKVKLIEPAIFEPELGGNSWKQTKKGKLDLGQGEG